MNVIVQATGDLRNYFGKEPHEIHLPEDAHIRELMICIEQRWGAALPSYLWDFEKHLFRGPIYLVVDNKAVQDLSTPLQDGLEISIIRAIAGG